MRFFLKYGARRLCPHARAQQLPPIFDFFLVKQDAAVSTLTTA
jgi:hypothetical protein